MKLAVSFDDVLLVPKFSEIKSRKDVHTSISVNSNLYDVPFMAANMDTIAGHTMANALHKAGAISTLHRFMTIEDNVNMFLESPKDTFVSIGTGQKEINRAAELLHAGATNFILDIAHGASTVGAETFAELTKLNKNAFIVVGNFATPESYLDFWNYAYDRGARKEPDMVKVGIGGGSNCTTRIVTGFGLPTLESVLRFRNNYETRNVSIIADGGIRNSGDVAKSLAAGAQLVMLGSAFSGTDETPGSIELVNDVPYKKYRGSASQESYEAQGKTAEHRTAEGVSRLVLAKGPVNNVIQELKAGLKSAMSYAGSKGLNDFRNNVEIVQITHAGLIESLPHGKLR